MISRVADHCFWLGRYLERAESTARVLHVAHGLALDGDLPLSQIWGPAITVTGEDASFDKRFSEQARADGETVQRYVTWELENPTSILTSVTAARENARSIREVLSLDAWEAINGLHLWLRSGAGQAEYENHREGFYRHLREAVALIFGTIRGTMLHDNAFDFISLGDFLERVGQTARILDVHHYALSTPTQKGVIEDSLWLSLLRACSGVEAFLRSQPGRVTPAAVAGFLLLNPHFPRSVLFGLRHALERFDKIRPQTIPELPGRDAHTRLSRLESWVSNRTAAHLSREDLHLLLSHVVDETAAVGADVCRELLSPPAVHTEANWMSTQSHCA